MIFIREYSWKPANYNTITSCNGSGNAIAIVLNDDSQYNIVDTCKLTKGGSTFFSNGVEIVASSNNTVRNSQIADMQNGIRIRKDGYGGLDSANNIIQNNSLINNDNNGNGVAIYLDASGNSIHTNTIANNSIGISINYYGNNNRIYNNLFENSDIYTAYVQNNYWDFGEKVSGPNIIGGSYLGGNYWINSGGTGWSQTCTNDGEGICTEKYEVVPGYFDNYPLASDITPVIPAPVAAFHGTFRHYPVQFPSVSHSRTNRPATPQAGHGSSVTKITQMHGSGSLRMPGGRRD